MCMYVHIYIYIHVTWHDTYTYMHPSIHTDMLVDQRSLHRSQDDSGIETDDFFLSASPQWLPPSWLTLQAFGGEEQCHLKKRSGIYMNLQHVSSFWGEKVAHPIRSSLISNSLCIPTRLGRFGRPGWCAVGRIPSGRCFKYLQIFSSCVRSPWLWTCLNMGVSENSVALNPMVLLIIIPIKWLFHWEY